jgi:phosphoribosylformylglycinamidine synthase
VSNAKPYLARVYVSLKPTVNDPEGSTIAGALASLGFTSVQGVRSGKFFQVRLTADSAEQAWEDIDRACARLLANPVIETYSFDIEETPAD